MPPKKPSPTQQLDVDLASLQALPLDQLEQEVLDSAARVSAHVGGAENFADSMGLGVGGESAESKIDPAAEVVRAASERLVAAGLLSMPTDRVTRDLRKVLQAVADDRSPGLYDVLSDDRDLMEVLEGVANGSWGIGGGSPSGVDAGVGPGTSF